MKDRIYCGYCDTRTVRCESNPMARCWRCNRAEPLKPSYGGANPYIALAAARHRGRSPYGASFVQDDATRAVELRRKLAGYDAVVVVDDAHDSEPTRLDGLAMPEVVSQATLPSGSIYTVYANGMTLLQTPCVPPKPDHPAPLNDLGRDSALDSSVKWWNR